MKVASIGCELLFLLAVSDRFGSSYLTHIELPVFLVAVGDDSADLRFLPSLIHPRIKGLKPRTAVANRLAMLCILPLLLAGVLGAPIKREELTIFLRQFLVESRTKENQSSKQQQRVPYIDAKVASANVLPALITLGSDQNLNVKFASIDAFGSVAQHFKVDMVSDYFKMY
ncbi:hypothetical protein Bca52824_022771 [Brassica carinata]|uniref:Uncharacterized protein n=1 Tax=Brassica carinata TaxID=52824 RepID=A0A8X8ARS6_BRACI|nr:hypothetical protein Bca52824_022771 [Brassica carinata]